MAVCRRRAHLFWFFSPFSCFVRRLQDWGGRWWSLTPSPPLREAQRRVSASFSKSGQWQGSIPFQFCLSSSLPFSSLLSLSPHFPHSAFIYFYFLFLPSLVLPCPPFSFFRLLFFSHTLSGPCWLLLLLSKPLFHLSSSSISRHVSFWGLSLCYVFEWTLLLFLYMPFIFISRPLSELGGSRLNVDSKRKFLQQASLLGKALRDAQRYGWRVTDNGEDNTSRHGNKNVTHWRF